MPDVDTNADHSTPPVPIDRGPIPDDLQEQLDQALKDLTEAVEPAWQRGNLAPDKVAKAVADYRARHPYRRPRP